MRSRTAAACSGPSSGRASATQDRSPIVTRQRGSASRLRAHDASGEVAATTIAPPSRSTKPTTTAIVRPDRRPIVSIRTTRPHATRSSSISPKGSGAAVVQAMLGDEGSGLRAALEVELREDRAHVVLDRLVREVDLGGDLLVGLPLGDQGEDLLLLGRELGQLVRVAAGRDPPDPLQDAFRDRRVQE